jgi:hypothetical protein
MFYFSTGYMATVRVAFKLKPFLKKFYFQGAQSENLLGSGSKQEENHSGSATLLAREISKKLKVLKGTVA